MFTHAMVAAIAAVVSVSSLPVMPVNEACAAMSPTLSGTTTLSARLLDERTGDLFGFANYKESKSATGTVARTLNVFVKGQVPNSRIEVLINDKVIGTILTDSVGAGSKEFDAVIGPTGTQDGGVPKIHPKDVIVVGRTKGQF